MASVVAKCDLVPSLRDYLDAVSEAYIARLLIPLTASIAVGLAYGNHFTSLGVLVGILLVLLPSAAAGALNNYVDWEIDEVNRKRVWMHRILGKRNLLLLALIPIGVQSLLIVNTVPPLAYVGGIALLFALTYSLLIKAKDVLGLNYLWIGVSFGPLPFLSTYFATGGNLPQLELGGVLLFLFLLHFSMCIVKDYGDIPGDKKLGKLTLPVVLGKRRALHIQRALLTITYAIAPIGVYLRLYQPAMLAVLLTYPVSLWILHRVELTEDDVQNRRHLDWMRFTALATLVMWAVLAAVTR